MNDKKLPLLFACIFSLAMSQVTLAEPAHQVPTPSLRMSEVIEAPWTRRDVPGIPQHGLALRIDESIGTSLIRELVLFKGKEMMGTQYVFGANRDDAVDCSSLVQQMFRTAGIHVPRTTRGQIRIGEAVNFSDLKPGDLLFYRFGRSGLHVAVYVEDGEVLHASTTRRKVIKSKLTDSWHLKMVTARRRL